MLKFNMIIVWGHGAMGGALVSHTRGPVFNSRWITVVSGWASDLNNPSATLVYKSVDP